MRALVTGSAGFIGYHVSQRLLSEGHEVLGVDGMTPFYDVSLKRARHALLRRSEGFEAHEIMLEDAPALEHAVGGFAPEIVVHLAAQAGVRHSLDAPLAYASANVAGTINLLETLRRRRPRHLLVASTSSVYGGNQELPFREADRTDFPVSVYAATKKAAEALCHAYAQLYDVPTTCFRFFTVYGPWGRPDMALFRFVDAIETGQPIEIFAEGRLERDFTYIEDLVEAVARLITAVPEAGRPIRAPGVIDSLSPVAPWRVVNVGSGHPVGLLAFVESIERVLGRPAIRKLLPMQPGDVASTWADPSLLAALTDYVPATSLDAGVAAFVEWYRGWRASLGNEN